MKKLRTLMATLAVVAVAAGCSQTDGSGGPESTGHGSPPTVETDEEIASRVPDQFKADVPVAVFTDWPPEEYVEGDEFKGWSVEMSTMLADVMGTNFDYKASGFDAIIPGIENGRYELAVASLGVTDERLKTLDFVPLQKEGTSFAWKKGNDEVAVNSIEEACGKSVAVLTGAWEYDLLTKKNPDMCGDDPMDIQQFKDQPSAELAVSSGRVDLVAAGSGKLGYAAQQSGSLEVADFIEDAVYNGIGVKKDSEMGPLLKDSLQAIIDSGEYAELRRSWGAAEQGDLGEAVLITEADPEGSK